MAKEVLTGSIGITTRMASIMVGPVSELPPFEKALTQTEWVLSAALFVDGVRSIVRRGSGGKWPMELDVRQPVVAGVGRMADVNLQLPGILLNVSNEALVAALEKHGGNRTQAGKELGILHGAVSNRIIRAAEGTPLAKFKEIKGMHGSTPDTSDATLAALLTQHNKNHTKVAELCGLERSSISSRITRAAEDSPLYAFKKRNRLVAKPKPTPPPRPPLPLPHLTDAAIAEALAAHRNNALNVAIQFRCGTAAIARRIELAAKDSPLILYRNKRF